MNPLDGWTPSVPEGSKFEIGTKEFKAVEKVGIRELGNVGFVLVAGGLGERLGYSGAKVRNLLRTYGSIVSVVFVNWSLTALLCFFLSFRHFLPDWIARRDHNKHLVLAVLLRIHQGNRKQKWQQETFASLYYGFQ